MFGRKNTDKLPKASYLIGDPEYEKEVMKAFTLTPKQSRNPFTWLKRRREQREYELFLRENNKFVVAREAVRSEVLVLGHLYDSLFSE